MKNISSFLVFILLVFSHHLKAQVRFILEKIDNTYTVYGISDETYTFPKQLVGSVQVTLRVPRTPNLHLVDFKSLNTDITWQSEDKMDNSSVAPAYIYYSYGIHDATPIHPQKNEKFALFSFKASGLGNSPIELLEPKDEMIAKAEKILHLNIGNNFSVITKYLIEEKYVGNLYEYGQIRLEQLYPNPCRTNVTLGWFNPFDKTDEPLVVQLVDDMGIISFQQELSNAQGTHQVALDVHSLLLGTYIVKLKQGSSASLAQRLVVVH